ncbi:MAG: PD-(D/E)XK nuclease family protein [Cyclobacteriaceae bacterium]|nr:PD-(D/E)XK nuclease family protein [Cyclobacteriaceae bacterium]
MKTFLQELAEKVYREHPKLDVLTFVFPNRRAALYFRKHLTDMLTKPAFAPQMLTVEDFIASYATERVPEKLELIHRLYKSYFEVVNRQADEPHESFDQFYFWGEMLLRDFNEIDKYMIDARHLFQDLRQQKELDASFDFLTDEQRDFLRSFWASFEENLTANKLKFLNVWNELFAVYTHFRAQLQQAGLAYEGMLHRAVALKIQSGETILPTPGVKPKIIFVGFNALTRAEEVILSSFVDAGCASVYWDMDAYYVNNNTQEAGKFFREYQEHPILKQTFPDSIPANFLRSPESTEVKSIKLFGAAQPVGQAKLMAQLLQEQVRMGINPEETLVVLPDEKLLMPVLHGVAGNINSLNVTMGFPLSSTPMFNLIELLAEMQIKRKGDHFNHRQVLAVLGHPYVVAADAAVVQAKRKEILKHNWVNIPKSFLGADIPLHRLLFQEVKPESESSASTNTSTGAAMIAYLKTIITEIGNLPGLSGFDQEYAYFFLTFLNQLEQVVSDPSSVTRPEKSFQTELKSFLRLFRQLVRAQKIPFSGEPLKGLQIMGVLETRNLDFKNVFVLSLNEGAFPSSGNTGSYIPYNIRRAYQLPTVEHQDAMYAYLFYRVLQRAENIFLFYNSETDVLGQGEMSRYLQQLIFESGLTIEKHVLDNTIQPRPIEPIRIEKDAGVLTQLAKLNEANGNYRSKGISPSALNSYIECRLKFYFSYVERIREADEVEEDLDARVLGTFLHDVMERFYKGIGERKKSKLIEVVDFHDYEITLTQLIDEVFIRTYRLDPGGKVEYEGQRLIVREMVRRFAQRIIELDKAYAPFTIEALEQEGMSCVIKLDGVPGYAVLGGKIDRVDKKDNVIRIVDYKTGKDKLDFKNVASLFERSKSRNKAAFQTLVYALLYKEASLSLGKEEKTPRLVPGLMSRMNLFDEDITFGLKMDNEYVHDVAELLPEFQLRLKELVEEIFDPAISFDQTTETDNCKYCPYREICYR